MRTAVCISGQCRTLDKTYENIRTALLSKLGPHDIFFYTSDDENCSKAALLSPTVLRVETDEPIDESSYKSRLTSKMQNYLQQLVKLKRVNEMRLRYEQENCIKYDFVLRLRPDCWFSTVNFDIRQLRRDTLYVPQWGGYGTKHRAASGFNDRFAVGGSEPMNHYFSQLDFFSAYSATNDEVCTPEMVTKAAVRHACINVRFIDVVFHLIRGDGLTPENREFKCSQFDFCKWEYAYLGERRPFAQGIYAAFHRMLFHAARFRLRLTDKWR